MLEKTRGFRDAIKNIDFTLIILTIAAAVFGIVMISSAGGDGSARICYRTVGGVGSGSCGRGYNQYS